jgi:hypothetical protein
MTNNHHEFGKSDEEKGDVITTASSWYIDK